MSAEPQLLDTNILVHAYTVSDERKHTVAKRIVRQAWMQGHGLTTLQNLCEFFFVVTRVQFLNMIRDANPLALEICHDGWILGGEEDYVQLLEEAFKRAERRYGLQKTESGWLMRGQG